MTHSDARASAAAGSSGEVHQFHRHLTWPVTLATTQLALVVLATEVTRHSHDHHTITIYFNLHLTGAVLHAVELAEIDTFAVIVAPSTGGREKEEREKEKVKLAAAALVLTGGRRFQVPLCWLC